MTASSHQYQMFGLQASDTFRLTPSQSEHRNELQNYTQSCLFQTQPCVSFPPSHVSLPHSHVSLPQTTKSFTPNHVSFIPNHVSFHIQRRLFHTQQCFFNTQPCVSSTSNNACLQHPNHVSFSGWPLSAARSARTDCSLTRRAKHSLALSTSGVSAAASSRGRRASCTSHTCHASEAA